MYSDYGQALSDREFDTTEVLGDRMDMMEATSLRFDDVPFDEMVDDGAKSLELDSNTKTFLELL